MNISESTENKQLTYEDAMTRLEAIAAELEKGELGLAEQLALYEEGIALAKRCQAELDDVDERLRQLGSDGEEIPLEGR